MTACADPRGTYQDFLARIPARTFAGLPDAGRFDEVPDVSGRFLVAVFTPLTSRPTESIADIQLIRRDSGATLWVVLQPLSARDRSPAGEPGVPSEVGVDAFGRFDVRLANVEFPGSANVVTGQDFTIDGKLVGLIRTPDHFCGFMEGAITEPTRVDLRGSTFGAIRLPPTGELPAPVIECVEPEELPDGGGSPRD